jgi:excisionase family DNA binding protein
MKSTVITPAGALSRADAAKYLSCSVRFLDKLAKAGRIPRLKQGSKTVYRPADLDKYLESCIQSPPAEV